ncbi:quinohemoprotein amine dehydrogenase subunit alpha, partial [Pseudomonas protegens]|uniref:quinohemoprotein amine dehydrogenase subunit alpha n=1 Tax=Pseudomonas protegens TaxID=380021 RepID=UPI00223B8C3A
QGRSWLLAVQPGYLKAGEEAEVTLVGAGLAGTPSFGKGVEVVQVLEQSPERIRLKLKAAASAQPGLREVSVGSLKGATLAVYNRIAEVKVVPAFAVARVGDGGGSTPKVQGRFDAEAWGQGADGKAYRIGVMPAQWKVEAFDEQAAKDEDVKYAGSMQADSGVFTPGDAGPNPQRKMSTNNAGNLKVIAAVDDAGKALTGEGQLIVTVQRWNNPPIP